MYFLVMLSLVFCGVVNAVNMRPETLLGDEKAALITTLNQLRSSFRNSRNNPNLNPARRSALRSTLREEAEALKSQAALHVKIQRECNRLLRLYPTLN